MRVSRAAQASYWIGAGQDKQHTSKREPGICGFYSVTAGYLPNATVAHEVGLHLADLRGIVERHDFVMLPLHNATPLRNKRPLSRFVEPICRVKRGRPQASSELLCFVHRYFVSEKTRTRRWTAFPSSQETIRASSAQASRCGVAFDEPGHNVPNGEW